MSLFLVKLRFTSANALSHWVMGELVEDTKDWVKLSESCNIYEMPNDKGEVQHIHVTDNLVSQGELVIPADCVAAKRVVSSDDAVIEGYERSLKAFKAQKAGLVLPETKSTAQAKALAAKRPQAERSN